MTNKVIERAKELLTIPQVNNEYQSKETEEAAKEWIFNQALITLEEFFSEQLKAYWEMHGMTRESTWAFLEAFRKGMQVQVLSISVSIQADENSYDEKVEVL